MKYLEIRRADLSLVGLRETDWEDGIFVTISPNPLTLHSTIRPISRSKARIPYGMLPQRLQYSYCRKVLKSYLWHLQSPSCFCTWELNEHGNVHLHCIFNSKIVKNETSLDILRREILCTDFAQRNLPTKGKVRDYMNSIVWITDSVKDRCKYLLKDIDNQKIFPYVISDDLFDYVNPGTGEKSALDGDFTLEDCITFEDNGEIISQSPSDPCFSHVTAAEVTNAGAACLRPPEDPEASLLTISQFVESSRARIEKAKALNCALN